MDSPCLRQALAAILMAQFVVAAGAQTGLAQTQECNLLSKQLVSQLEGRSSERIDAEAEQQRSMLRAQGCDPQLTGYDTEIEGMKLNQELDFKPESEGNPFRLDKLIEIEY